MNASITTTNESSSIHTESSATSTYTYITYNVNSNNQGYYDFWMNHLSDLHDWYADDEPDHHTHYLARHTHYSDADVQANVFLSVMLLWLVLVALFCFLYKFNDNDDRCATSTHTAGQIPTAVPVYRQHQHGKQYGVQQPLIAVS